MAVCVMSLAAVRMNLQHRHLLSSQCHLTHRLFRVLTSSCLRCLWADETQGGLWPMLGAMIDWRGRVDG